MSSGLSLPFQGEHHSSSHPCFHKPPSLWQRLNASVQGTRNRAIVPRPVGHRVKMQTACSGEDWRGTSKSEGLRPLARIFSCPQESVNRLHAQMQAFVSESKRAAELEEKRRYRFLAEKHLLLSNTFLQFLGRVSRAGESKPRPPGAVVRLRRTQEQERSFLPLCFL